MAMCFDTWKYHYFGALEFVRQNPAERHVFLLCSEVLSSSKLLSVARTAWVIETGFGGGWGRDISSLFFCPRLLLSSPSVFDLQADQ